MTMMRKASTPTLAAIALLAGLGMAVAQSGGGQSGGGAGGNSGGSSGATSPGSPNSGAGSNSSGGGSTGAGAAASGAASGGAGTNTTTGGDAPTSMKCPNGAMPVNNVCPQ